MSIEVAGNEPIPLDLELKKLSNIDIKFPDFPTEVTFLLGRHDFSTDLPEDIEDAIRANDLILLEGVCWDDADLQQIKAISNGDKNALLQRQAYLSGKGDEFGARLASAIFDSGKPVRFNDIPGTRRNREALDKVKATFSLNDVPNFQVFMNKTANQMNTLIKSGIFERDKYMIRGLYPIITEALGIRNTKEPAKALFIVGGAHKTVSYAVKKQIAKRGVEKEHSVLENIDLTSDYTQLAYYEFLTGKPISEDSLIKSLIERLINVPTEETHSVLHNTSTEAAVSIYRKLLVKSGFEWAQEAHTTDESTIAISGLLRLHGYNAD